MTMLPAQTPLLATQRWSDEARWRSVAREIARDLFPLDAVLKHHGVTPEEWEEMEDSRGFTEMLLQESTSWNSSLNTEERIRVRTLAAIEESLPEYFRAAHDPKFGDAPKVEILKTFARMAGIGSKESNGGGSSENFKIVINMGAEKPLTVEHQVTPEGNTIEGQAFEVVEK